MSDPMARLANALADRYEIEREIGSGGMAIVYLARDLKHNRQVAIKVLRPELAAALGAERFLREIETSAGLNHPHILTLIDSGEADEILFYVLPYVEGESLRERLDHEGRLDPAETARLITQIADALDYAHEQGVLHRDIKPENILLHRGTAMVSDFGIAVGLAAARDGRLTGTGTSIGTPSYMSPEQVEGKGEVDARSDVYAVGCLTYEMLVGEPPFTGSPQTITAKVLTADPPDVSEVRDDVPPAVCASIAKALSRAPESRYATVGELASALGEGTTPVAAKPTRRSPAMTALLAVGALAIAALTGRSLLSPRGTGEATAIALAEIDRAVLDKEWIRAWELARTIDGQVSDSTMERVWSQASIFDTIVTEPPGASVSWRPFAAPDEEWRELGVTPLATHLPRTLVTLRLELSGHDVRLASSDPYWSVELWRLAPTGEQPPDVVHVPEQTLEPRWSSSSLALAPTRTVSEYLIDKYEVTNARYREFVDAGGYTDPEYWEYPIEQDGRVIGWEDAMALMVDRTGRPGPSTWEVGTYPESTAEHPVTGVSWYEAMAFATWAGRSLPTLYHWQGAAWVLVGWGIAPLSNLDGDGTVPVGELSVATPIGVYDMAGNAREWVVSAQGNMRFALGGGWDDPDYSFSLLHPLPPLDRSRSNGFRLISYLGDSTELAALSEPVQELERDFSNERPVSDDVFDIFLSLYNYDRPPLNPEIERVDTVRTGIRQRVMIDVANGSDRIPLYLFLPPNATPPLQTVFYWPGSGVLRGGNIEVWSDIHVSALVQSGRAVAFPVFKSMWEREDDFEYVGQDPSNDHRDHVISWRQDLGRILDYLETRPDIDPDGFSYMGYSWGARMGVIMLALEPRFRAGVLYVGGLHRRPTQAVVEVLNFAPRVTTPVLMLNGRYDPVYQLETQAKPLFELLGSEDKFHYISEGGHDVPYAELIRETLRWLDTYVGPVTQGVSRP